MICMNAQQIRRRSQRSSLTIRTNQINSNNITHYFFFLSSIILRTDAQMRHKFSLNNDVRVKER